MQALTVLYVWAVIHRGCLRAAPRAQQTAPRAQQTAQRAWGISKVSVVHYEEAHHIWIIHRSRNCASHPRCSATIATHLCGLTITAIWHPAIPTASVCECRRWALRSANGRTQLILSSQPKLMVRVPKTGANTQSIWVFTLTFFHRYDWKQQGLAKFAACTG